MEHQTCVENAENLAITSSQERVWGNKGSTDFNILNLHGGTPEQVCCGLQPLANSVRYQRCLVSQAGMLCRPPLQNRER